MTIEMIVLGLLVFGLGIGVLTARSSDRREKVQGGIGARFFNYIASALWSVVTPTVLISVLVLHVPILQALLVGVGLVGLAFLSTLLYAVFEKPALERLKDKEDRGWTAQDAVTSGL